MEDVDEPTKDPCPDCGETAVKVSIVSPAIVDPVIIGIKKAPADFQKYVLGRIKESVPNNVIGQGRAGSLTREI